MGPKRKKTSSVLPEAMTSAAKGEHGGEPNVGGDVQAAGETATSPTTAVDNDQPDGPPQTPSRSSWYGSWRAKTQPVAQIAKESISVAKGATSESSEVKPRRPSSVSKSVRGSSRKSTPLVAEATKVHATSDANSQAKPLFPSGEKLRGLEAMKEVKGAAGDAEAVVDPSPLPPGGTETATAETNGDAKSVQSNASNPRQVSGRWWGWWSRPDDYGMDGEKQNKRPRLDQDEHSESTPVQSSSQGPAVAQESTGAVAAKNDAEPLQVEDKAPRNSTRSWFGGWSNTQNLQANAADEQTRSHDKTLSLEQGHAAAENAPSATREGAGNRVSEGPAPDIEQRPRSSGWAFWSSDRAKDAVSTLSGTQKQVGELAVADTPSQSHPEAAQFNQQREQAQREAEAKLSGSRLRNMTGGGKSSEASPVLTPADTGSVRTTSANTRTDQSNEKDPSDAPTPVGKGKKSQKRPNLVIPAFRATFPHAPNPGYMERLAQYLAQSLRLPGSQPLPPPQHIFITESPPKIRRAVALGVHGFFPAPLLQKVLGPPTGTSIRFANYAASSIRKWCHDHQPDLKNVEVETVALEGEGYIADRITTLWKLLLNWLSHIRQADFIFVACHSQGVPVAVTLVAKLIQLGCLNSHVRIGVCAMAGINLGPFSEYRTRLFGGTALELFDLCDNDSRVSRAYAESLETCLRHGVRVTFVGSIDDQLVSLESSLHMPLSHPYVCRAVFVDGRVHAPNFLSHLVVFALKLRNLGIGDHGLIRELSAPLAGNLVGGEGHSRVYDDVEVYDLAIAFALESTDVQPRPSAGAVLATGARPDRNKAREAALARRASVGGITPSSPAHANSIRRGSLSSSSESLPGIAPVFATYEPPPAAGSANPFYLPWAVRGMLEEPLVKSEMQAEVHDLVTEFECWTPTSKGLKDVRWRLEGVRSML